MKKYLYVFNYPPEQEEICKLEYKYLFQQDWNTKCNVSEIDVPIDRSAFIKAKIDIFVMGSNLDTCIKELIKKKLEYFDFKIIYLKNEITHVEYQMSLSWCKDISWAIEGTVNMAKPKHTIAVTKIEENWIIGYYHHGVPSWKERDDKPHTFSNSLDVKLARTLVNIASGGDMKLRIVDPCCGMGTVVLEGLALNHDIEGFDISKEIAYMARQNVIHYGYDGYLINRVPIQELEKHYDVAIIDMPYNLYTPITYEEQCQIINAARRICEKLVIVAYEDMSKELNQAGFLILDTCLLRKTNYVKFRRIIYVCI